MESKHKARKETKFFVVTILSCLEIKYLRQAHADSASSGIQKLLIHAYLATFSKHFLSPQSWKILCPLWAWVNLYCLVLRYDWDWSSSKRACLCSRTRETRKIIMGYIYLTQMSLEQCVVLKAESRRCLQWLLEGQILWPWDLGILVLIHKPELQCNLLKVWRSQFNYLLPEFADIFEDKAECNIVK